MSCTTPGTKKIRYWSRKGGWSRLGSTAWSSSGILTPASQNQNTTRMELFGTQRSRESLFTWHLRTEASRSSKSKRQRSRSLKCSPNLRPHAWVLPSFKKPRLRKRYNHKRRQLKKAATVTLTISIVMMSLTLGEFLSSMQGMQMALLRNGMSRAQTVLCTLKSRRPKSRRRTDLATCGSFKSLASTFSLETLKERFVSGTRILALWSSSSTNLKQMF